ncbi:hypothetical protein OKW21_000634 [Catalinimonas alkaloidigena]|uniref:UPF0158 family protein n=1 Tax=Catalinimonas alkaloidigena TaxID=1075417 RepID=UPI002406716E|nr:UPF0158 family protein [Catalinimonas alkaloidigena]MDF9795371.1 hypothetical protein [Catalinimonas alkaloidigena]
MKLTDEHIAEIAELLESGMICFFHRENGTIEFHPDQSDLYYDPEPWQDIIDKIENDWDNYNQFVKMDSNQGFRVMEEFAYSISDSNFRSSLLNRLSGRKPFQNFKILIDASAYRQDWFDFKKRAYIKWVEQQIEIDT